MDGESSVPPAKYNEKCNIDGIESGRARKDRAKAAKKLSIAVGICIVFMICEVIGGIISQSLAILADAVHLLSDIAGFAIALFAIYASGWEANPRQSFGYYRVEILGALLSIQLIWLVTGVLVYEAILRFIHPTETIDGQIMFGVASGGLAVNVLIMCALGHGGHGHSHGHNDNNNNKKNTHHSHGHYHSKEHGSQEEHKSGEQNHSNESKNGFFTKLLQIFGMVLVLVLYLFFVFRFNFWFKMASCIIHEIKIILLQILGIKSHHRQFSKSNILLNQNEDNKVHKISIINRDEGDCLHRSRSVFINKDLRVEKKMKEENINIRAAYLHAFGDFVQSIGVMIVGAIIWCKPNLYIVDPICTLIFSTMVLLTTYTMIRDVVHILMESTPREIDAGALEAGLLELNGVEEVHELHIWAITVGRSLLACHIQAAIKADTNEVLHNVTKYVEKVYNISHVTIQVEQGIA